MKLFAEIARRKRNRDIVELYKGGISIKGLAAWANVTPATVRKILRDSKESFKLDNSMKGGESGEKRI